MQDAVFQDMFNLGGINSSRYNGHISVSSSVCKRDRKGCKKGKIEAIMKNNMVSSKSRVRLQTSPVVKKIKAPQSSSNYLKSSPVVKSETLDFDDPYTFTETEPLTLYPGTTNLTLSRKLVPLVNNRINQVTHKPDVKMVCIDRDSTTNKVTNSSTNHRAELSSRSVVPKANRNIQIVEGSSGTMNRLQADIARNKVIGKRKKMVVSSVSGNGWENREIKTEPNTSQEMGFNSSVCTKVMLPAKRKDRHTTWQRERKYRHEALQKLQLHYQEFVNAKQDLYPLGLEVSDSESDGNEWEDCRGVFQRHWFMGCGGVQNGVGREPQLTQVSGELRRRVCQVWQGMERGCAPKPELVSSIIDAARKYPNSTALLLHPRLKPPPKLSRAKTTMLVPQKCSLDCDRMAMPCTRHCAQHIMYNVDQQLFKPCSAKYADNTPCRMPVFDITRIQPLCSKHAAIYDEAMKPLDFGGRQKKSAKKKSKPAALTRSTKRGKKKKKPRPSNEFHDITSTMSEVEVKTEPMLTEDDDGSCMASMSHMMLHSSPSAAEVYLTDAMSNQQVEIQVQLEDAVEEVSDEVLAMASSLDPAELASQATRLLDEHDITSMFNQIPADAFTEIFLEEKNGAFPTVEETEGLERALEEVDKEVRSLEIMTSSMPALPMMPIDSINLLDDVGYVPGYHPNGFAAIAQPELRHS